MRIIQGDLIRLALQGTFDVIIHGCNCHCSMNAGIARAIREHFPEAYQADRRTIAGDATKLGTISSATVIRDGRELTIINGYTQFNYSGSGVLVDYDALRGVMRSVKSGFTGQRIGYPKIGAGLAKGDWSTIARIIDEELEGEHHTLVEFA